MLDLMRRMNKIRCTTMVTAAQPYKLKIIYDKPTEEENYSGYIYKGLAKRSFNLGYKVAAKFELEKLEAEMKDGLLHLFIPTAESKKPKSIKIK